MRGWDPDRKEAVVGTAPAGTVSAQARLVALSSCASKFGDPPSCPSTGRSRARDEVDALPRRLPSRSRARSPRRTGSRTGNPKPIGRVRRSASGLTGEPFDGLYTVTSSRHVFDTDGYRTHFGLSGSQVDRCWRSLPTASTNGKSPRGTRRAYHGVVTGQVTSVSDGTHQARVKLTFPWLSETYESDWVRVVQPGAGKDRGFVVPARGQRRSSRRIRARRRRNGRTSSAGSTTARSSHARRRFHRLRGPEGRTARGSCRGRATRSCSATPSATMESTCLTARRERAGRPRPVQDEDLDLEQRRDRDRGQAARSDRPRKAGRTDCEVRA